MKEYIDERLEELSAQATTEKQAGYNYVWSSFLSNVFESGYDEAVRSASLTKFAGSDPFAVGQNEAIERILSGSDEKNLKELKLAYDKQEVGKDFVDLAFYGEKTMETYELGKEAAFNDMVDRWEQGEDIFGMMDSVRETLSQELNKYASEEDEYYRLGVEAVCYDFLKQASDVFGEYNVEYDEGDLALEVALEKMAGRAEGPSRPGAQGFADKAKLHAEGVAAAAKGGAEKVKEQGGKALGMLSRHKGKAGLATLGAAGAYGLKKLHDKKKKEQSKKASLQFDFDEIEEAVMALQEAGFEIE